jgi:hypothetical protein
VHFLRTVLARAGKQGRRVVAAFIATAFAQDDAETARTQWRQVADQLRSKLPKLARLMDQAETDVLAYMSFPKDHRPKIHSTNPLERLNGEIKRRTEVVGIFPNEDAITRLVGALLLEQNDEWAVQRARYMTLETIALFSQDLILRRSYTTPWGTIGWGLKRRRVLRRRAKFLGGRCKPARPFRCPELITTARSECGRTGRARYFYNSIFPKTRSRPRVSRDRVCHVWDAGFRASPAPSGSSRPPDFRFVRLGSERN